jgi:hypothetical protein
MKYITTGILRTPFKKKVMLYCLDPTNSFTFGCAYWGMFLQREPESNWCREYYKGEVFVCEDDVGNVKRMSTKRFAKKLS